MSDERADGVFSKPLDMKHIEPARPTDWRAFMDVVESRRSIRVFEPTPVDPNDVRECLRAALLAPNSSNLQAWEFHWVKSPDKKSAIVEACLSQPAAKTAQELIVCVARTKTWEKMRHLMIERLKSQGAPKPTLNYYEKLVPMAYGLGPLGLFGWAKKIALWFIGLTRAIPREPTSEADMRIWAVKSAALACENLMLAFRARGLDSCPMEGFDSKRVRKILTLPSDAMVVMIVSAGYRAKNGVYGPQIRFQEDLFIKEV